MILPKAYNAKKVEERLYNMWESHGLFKPSKSGDAFVISMPPPNATGQLHMGHAVMLALQDIMIRYYRMKGCAALWVPGTDHASIATQNKVEKILAEQGKSRHDLGRVEFLRRVNSYVKESQDIIKKQVRKMGSSCDWSRERYTLDKGLTRAVQVCFVKMYKDGLIYRGNRIVNWCPRCASTLADDEVEYKTAKAKFYYFKYGPIIIGTARPETKFLDKTIIVHPKDKRYKHLVGKKFKVPWIEGDVDARVIADESVDIKMGTGAMTITPAHSFVDFELAQKHKLPVVQIIDEQGNLTAYAGQFAGQNALKSRDKIVKKMQAKGLVHKIDENYEHNLSVCYRCNTTIEPLVSKQWFVNVNKKIGKKKQSLKEMAIAVVKKNEINIVPKRFDKTYFHWMENLRDWCISRQIWFGHRIPVWYCMGDKKCRLECNNPIVSVEVPKKCPCCGSKNIKQDQDTLDTWFSSGLWTFSTLGWPEKTKDLKRFHPTSVMETGYDILFFWVARMILMSTYNLGDVPFKTVYLHGLVRDKKGRKMSKSLGNGIDPLDMIKKYGADAVRLSLVIGSTPGNDIRLYQEKIAGYRNYINKIWNISRYVITKSKIRNQKSKIQIKNQKLTLSDKWILYELDQLVKKVNKNLENFRFSAAGELIYDFVWHKFADWYIEATKVEKCDHQQAVLEYVLEKCLIMLHPFVPFVTEHIWEIKNQKSKIKNSNQKSKMLIVKEWVKKIDITTSKKSAEQFNQIQEIITAIRNARAEQKVLAGEILKCEIVSKDKSLFAGNQKLIEKLARVKIQPGWFGLQTKPTRLNLSRATVYLEKIKQQVSKKETEELKNYIKDLKKRLKNKAFLKNAPAHVIKKEKARLKETKAKLSV